MASISRNSIPLEHQRTFSSCTGRDDVTPIWCLNTSQDLDGTPSEVIITVRQADGQVMPLVIPQAALAIEVTSLAPRAALVNSSHFIKAVQSGLITLVTDQYAEDFNSRPLAMEERARLYQRQQAITGSVNDRQTVTETGNHRSEITVVRTAPNPALASVTAEVAPPATAPDSVDLTSLMNSASGVSEQFKEWVEHTNCLALPGALDAYQARGRVTKQEAQYIVANTTHEPIRKYLASRV